MENTGDNVAHKAGGAAKPWLWLLLICLIVVAILAGLKYLQISRAIAFAASFPERSETVTAITVTPSSLQQTYRTIGEVQATQYLELRTEVDGKISAINFSGGDAVAADQWLIALDSSEEQAQLAATRARLKLAELQLKRVLALRQKNLASNNDVDIAKADKDVLLANVAALVATIEKKTLTAPFAAVTDLHNLQVGQYLAANSLVTELNGNLDDYWVDFKLPQEKAVLSVGDSVQLSARHFIDHPIIATIHSADARIQIQSRSRGYRALITDAPSALRPGAVLDVLVELGKQEGVFRLPLSAVRRSNFGAFVYVLQDAEPGAVADYRAERRQVTIGDATDQDIVVLSGLSEGELVAGIGAFKLEEGLLVNVVERVARPTSVTNP